MPFLKLYHHYLLLNRVLFSLNTFSTNDEYDPHRLQLKFLIHFPFYPLRTLPQRFTPTLLTIMLRYSRLFKQSSKCFTSHIMLHKNNKVCSFFPKLCIFEQYIMSSTSFYKINRYFVMFSQKEES